MNFHIPNTIKYSSCQSKQKTIFFRLMTYLEKDSFALIAHRGGTHGHEEVPLPENTILAFERTQKLDPNFIFELDVHQSRDGEIIVMHDDSVDRTTGGHGKIKDLNSKDILKLDAGYKTPFRSQKVPRLEDILDAFPNSKVSIDLKIPGYEKKTLDVIIKSYAQNRVVIASEFDAALRAAQKINPDLCYGYGKQGVARMLAATTARAKFLAPTAGNVFQIPVRTKNLAVYSKRFLNLAHSLSKHVHIWTINDETVMDELINDGVDGIVTDNPATLLRAAQRFQKIKESK